MSVETIYPYVGIRPFNSDENLFFFGRDEQTLEILQRLHENHFVAVVGGSGSGKSSLIRAGLIPALKGGYLVEDSNKWLIAIMKPGQNPMYNLAQAILQQVDPSKTHPDFLNFVVQLKKEGVKAIINLVEPLRKEQNINFFLLIDQFEELFRFAMELKDADKKTEAFDFVNMMLNLSTQKEVPFYIVLTMRSDFIGDCAQFHDLPEALNKSQYLIPRLNRQQLKMVIEGPAKLFGGKFSPALTSQLLNDLGNVKDELPLIQHALMRIWDYELVVDKNGILDLGDYKAIGGFEKALDIHADEALNSLGADDRKIAKVLFQALTEIDDNKRKIRRPLLLKDLKQLTGASEEKLLRVIDHFIRDMRAFLILENTGEKGDQLIDISHESLIRQWDTLGKWVEEEGESASAYKKLAEDTRLHKLKKKDFLTGSELQLALEWRDKFKPTAVWAHRYIKHGFEDCMQYLEASENERSRITNQEKARRKKMRYMWAALGVLLVFITGYSFYTMNEANQLAEQVKANYLRSEIYRNGDADPTYALRLAQQALKDPSMSTTTDPNLPSDDPTLALRLLEQAISMNDTIISRKDADNIYHKNSFYKIIVRDSSFVKSVAFSEDGKTILTGSEDYVARLWNLEGKLLQKFEGHKGAITTVAFSPKDNTILTGSQDGTVRLWDLAGKSLKVLKDSTRILAVVYSRKGTIITGSQDGTVSLWDSGGKLLKKFKAHSSAILAIALSPKGDTILTGSADRMASLHDMEGNVITPKFKKKIGHSGPITSVAFSPDGKTIVTGSEDWTARLWDLEKEEEYMQEFIGHEAPITSVAFAPDGNTILTGSYDKTARIWQLKGELLQVVKGHTGPINSLAFSTDGKTILTGSDDRTGRIWNLKVELFQIFKGHTGAIKSAVFSPDGKTILTGSEDKTACLWDLKGKKLQEFKEHEGTVYSVAFSPDGNNVLTGSRDKIARLWDIRGKLLHEFKGHGDRIYSVTFSPDGKSILTGSMDKTARLWDIKGDSLMKFVGHEAALYSVAFSWDGKAILTGSEDQSVRLWDLDGNMLQEFKGHTGAINSVGFSRDGSKILSGSEDQTARLWDINGTLRTEYIGHRGPVNSVAFSPDGKSVLTGSYDRTARLWDLKGKVLQEFKGHSSYVNTVAFSPDGGTILTGSYDNTARLWKVAQPLEEFLQTEWGEPLSKEQQEKFGIDKAP